MTNIKKFLEQIERGEMVIDSNFEEMLPNGFSPLHYVASVGNIQLLLGLIHSKLCAIDEEDKNGNTPLMWAVSFVDEDGQGEISMELIEALIDSGANINQVNHDGETPLFTAVKLNSEDKVEYLLENNANPNAKNIEGCSPLHFAAEIGNEAIVEALLMNGAYVNNRDDMDECALYWAVRFGGSQGARIIQLLVEHGAMLEIYNEDGETPLDLAVSLEDKEIIECLLSLGASGTGTNNFHEMVLEGEDQVHERHAAVTRCVPWDSKALHDGNEATTMLMECESTLAHLVV